VALHGSTRATPTIAALLGAAGIGRVSVAGEGDVRLHQTSPGGLSASDEGSRYAAAVTSALARAAPDCDTRALVPESAADLVVVVGVGPMNVVLRDRLHERDLAHLRVEIYPDRAVVGPLVVPGWFSCLHCADLHRLDRDPAWSLLAVQLESPRRHPEPTDVILSSMAASLAAMQCLAYLDGELPATIEGSLELQPPDWRIRRRSWPPHPDCECGASR
jgi:bacteriocin biosynthesis cyclodehydratase domain-containing protein